MRTTPRRQSTSPRTPSPTTTATPSCTDTRLQLQSSPLSQPPFPPPTWDAPTLWPCITPNTAAPATPSVTPAEQASSPRLPTPTLTRQTAWNRCTTPSCWLRWTAASSSSIWVPLQRVRTWQAWHTGPMRLACKDLRASYRPCCPTPPQLCITVVTTTPNLVVARLPCCKDTWSDLKLCSYIWSNGRKKKMLVYCIFLYLFFCFLLWLWKIFGVFKVLVKTDILTQTLVLIFSFPLFRDKHSSCDNKYCTVTILTLVYILKVFFLYFLHFWEINICKLTHPLLYFIILCFFRADYLVSEFIVYKKENPPTAN